MYNVLHPHPIIENLPLDITCAANLGEISSYRFKNSNWDQGRDDSGV